MLTATAMKPSSARRVEWRSSETYLVAMIRACVAHSARPASAKAAGEPIPMVVEGWLVTSEVEAADRGGALEGVAAREALGKPEMDGPDRQGDDAHRGVDGECAAAVRRVGVVEGEEEKGAAEQHEAGGEDDQRGGAHQVEVEAPQKHRRKPTTIFAGDLSRTAGNPGVSEVPHQAGAKGAGSAAVSVVPGPLSGSGWDSGAADRRGQA